MKKKEGRGRHHVPLHWKIIKILFWVLTPPCIAACAAILYNTALTEITQHSSCRIAAYGFAAGCLAWPFVSRFLLFFEVFIHEMTHLAVGLIFLRRPRAIVASEEGGRTEIYGGNFVITLAPYFFPLIPAVLIAVSPLLQSFCLQYLYAALGFFTGVHLITAARQFRFYQPDVREAGAVFSMLFCLFGNLLVIVCLLGFTAGGLEGTWQNIKLVYIKTRMLFISLFGFTYSLVRPYAEQAAEYCMRLLRHQ